MSEKFEYQSTIWQDHAYIYQFKISVRIFEVQFIEPNWEISTLFVTILEYLKFNKEKFKNKDEVIRKMSNKFKYQYTKVFLLWLFWRGNSAAIRTHFWWMIHVQFWQHHVCLRRDPACNQHNSPMNRGFIGFWN